MMSEATAAQQQGNYDVAESRYRQVTQRYPQFPDAWHYYGILLHQRGDQARSLEMLRRAERLDPQNLVFLLNLANVLREQHKLTESLQVLERAYKIAPTHGQVFAQFVHIYRLVHRGGDLIDEIETRMQSSPGNWHLWMMLGECCEQGGERERAIEALSEAARLAPDADKAKAHLRRGWMCHAAGNTEGALKAFQDAAAAAPASGWAHIGLATLASERADFVEATRLARKTLELDKNIHAAWRILANTAPERNTPAFLKELNEAVATAEEEPRAWLLHFAHGQILEKHRKYDEAFAAYAKGNSLRRNHDLYSREEQDRYTTGIIENLGPEFLARGRAIGLDTAAPIFICGMPRSGTTLVESIIAAHPEVMPGGEMRYIHDRLRQKLRYKTEPETGPWIAQAADEILREIAEGWNAALQHAAAGHSRVTDKMPSNFCILGLIQVCLPNARIVHVRRDPRDTSFSCFATPFSEELWYSFDLGDIGHHYLSYLSLIDHWRKVLGPEKIIEVEYEQMAREPERATRELLAALDLEWDPRCLDFHKASRKVSTASVYQVRQPVYTQSIGRWRHFEKHLTPLLEIFGNSQILTD
jgi:tetratricopeptide (TPR) repeat protein